MKGWIVENNYLNTDKFSIIYKRLSASFKKYNIEIQEKLTGEIDTCLTSFMVEKPDFVIFWDKDIYVAKRLENLGIRCYNSSDAIYKCDNKIITYLELSKYDIRIPKTFLIPKTFEGIGYINDNFIYEIEKNIKYPIILKEAYGSFGKQVYLLKNREELKEKIRQAGYKELLIQEYISESCGKDVRVNIVGNKAVVSILRKNSNDFRSNITNGGTALVTEITEEQKYIAEKASKVLGLDFCGIDILFGNEGPVICEVNSNPNFESTYKCTGVDLSEKIAEYIIKKETGLSI